MSLRARLLVGMGVVGVVLVVAAVVITRSTESYLVDRVDVQLVAAQQSVQARGASNAARPPGGSASVGERPGTQNTPLYVGVGRRPRQGRFDTSPFYAGSDAPLPAVDAEPGRRQRRQSGDRTVHGRHRSAFGHPVPGPRHPRPRRRNTYVAALSLADVDASVSRLIWVEVIITGLVLGILGLVTWWVIRLGVRPVKQMTATATAIAGGDLSHRVPSGHEGTEAGELGDALNTMLTRIEEAFDERSASEARLRQFIADASHELRTPVATIRGYAELYRRGGLEEREALQQAMRRTEAETLRMGSLIDDLLLLARLDQGRPLEQAPVDLGVLAVDAAADARARAPERRVTASVSEGVVVNGDEHRLRQLVANLVSNALVHTPPDAPIEARVRTRQRQCGARGTRRRSGHVTRRRCPRRSSASTAPTLRGRATTAAQASDLSIVRAIVDAHGGTVTLDTALGQGRRCGSSYRGSTFLRPDREPCGRIATWTGRRCVCRGRCSTRLTSPAHAFLRAVARMGSRGARGPRPGYPPGDGWSRLRPADRSTKIEIQFEEHYARPVWPGAAGAQGMQLHLDIWVRTCRRCCVGARVRRDGGEALNPRIATRAGCGSCSTPPATRSASGPDSLVSRSPAGTVRVVRPGSPRTPPSSSRCSSRTARRPPPARGWAGPRGRGRRSSACDCPASDRQRCGSRHRRRAPRAGRGQWSAVGDRALTAERVHERVERLRPRQIELPGRRDRRVNERDRCVGDARPGWPATSPAMIRTSAPPSGDDSSVTFSLRMSW